LTSGLKEDNVFAAAPPPSSTRDKGFEAVGAFAKSHGQNRTDDGLSPRARKLIGQAKSSLLTPEQQESISPENVKGVFHQYAIQFLQSPLGWPFRQEFCRRVAVVILGTPYGDVSVIVDAIESLARLAVTSLAEDSYGKVQADVPAIIRTFTATITRLESFVSGLPLHWTDIKAKKESPEADLILAALRRGLGELVEAFGPFSDDLRLGRAEMRAAREAAAGPKKQDMRVRDRYR
jgi:hypothetical protein